MQVKRQRVSKVQSGLFGRRTGSRIRLVAAGTAALAIASAGVSYATTTQFGTQQVGQTTDRGQVVSADQYIKPIGQRLVIPLGKIMSSSVSPDGTHLAASLTDGGQVLAIVDLKNYKVQQYVGNNAQSNLKITGGDVGQEARRTRPTVLSCGWAGPTATPSSP
jgi:hypothetical protein